jgi:hypothetical protein
LKSIAIGGVLSDKQVARRSSNGGSRLHVNRHWNINKSAKAIRAKSKNQLNHKISFPRTSNTVANVCDWQAGSAAIGFWLRLLDSLRFVIRLVAAFQHDSLRSPRDVLVFCSVFAGFDFRILLRSGWHFAPLVFLWGSFFGSRFLKRGQKLG